MWIIKYVCAEQNTVVSQVARIYLHAGSARHRTGSALLNARLSTEGPAKNSSWVYIPCGSGAFQNRRQQRSIAAADGLTPASGLRRDARRPASRSGRSSRYRRPHKLHVSPSVTAQIQKDSHDPRVTVALLHTEPETSCASGATNLKNEISA